MIVGIIAEGSYPYVSGGVSTWLQQLMENMPDINFKILSIMPSHDDLPSYKYVIPTNVISIDTVLMNDFKKSTFSLKRKNKLDNKDIAVLEKFINFDKMLDWSDLSSLLNSESKNICPESLLQGKPLWDHIVERYERDFSKESFNSYVWAVKSMITPLLHFMKEVDFQADVYHVISTGYAGVVGASLKIKFNKPLILTEHGMYVKEREQELLDIDWIPDEFKKLWIDFFYFMSLGCYRNSDLIISLYEGSSQIQLSHGAPHDKLRIIPNGVDTYLYTPLESKHDKITIGSIIRIVPIKDVETMLNSFKIVLEQFPNINFKIVGPYDEDKEYFKLCNELLTELSLNDHVEFTGHMDISAVINDFDILVFTSKSEGQPLAILEGMSSGIPIVATNVGACSELILEDEYEGPCGLITNTCSSKETAKAILKLINDEDLRINMGLNGRNRTKKNYDISRVIAQYREMYQSMKRSV